MAAVQVNALLLQSLLISMRNLDKYTAKHASRKWFTDNWGASRYISGYPAHHHICCHPHHKHPKGRALRKCATWVVLGVSNANS